MNDAPWSTLSQRRSPPCWRAMPRAIARPRPAPGRPGRGCRAVRSARRSARARPPATPGPSSTTRTSASDVVPVELRAGSLRRAGAALAALSSRLRTTRAKRAGVAPDGRRAAGRHVELDPVRRPSPASSSAARATWLRTTSLGLGARRSVEPGKIEQVRHEPAEPGSVTGEPGLEGVPARPARLLAQQRLGRGLELRDRGAQLVRGVGQELAGRGLRRCESDRGPPAARRPCGRTPPPCGRVRRPSGSARSRRSTSTGGDAPATAATWSRGRSAPAGDQSA